MLGPSLVSSWLPLGRVVDFEVDFRDFESSGLRLHINKPSSRYISSKSSGEYFPYMLIVKTLFMMSLTI